MQGTRDLNDTPTLNTPSGRRRVIVFGGTGKVGRLVVADALERGHTVTVFGRHPEAIDIDHPRLRVIRGDVLDADAVAAGIRDHDAVICALGRPPLDRSRLRARGTANIVAGMQAHGVRRLVCLSVMGLGDSWHNLPWSYKRVVVPIVLGRVVADHREQEALVMASDLDWTLVRPPNLTDGPPAAAVRHGFGGDVGPVGMHVPRVDVARFMVDQLHESTYAATAVAITA